MLKACRALEIQSGHPSSEDLDQSKSPDCASSSSGRRTLQEPGNFLSTLKVDSLQSEFTAFTPKAVCWAPAAPRLVDFAYMVHTKSATSVSAQRSNGQIGSLRNEITSGDVVEILTQKGTTQPRLGSAS